MKTETIQYELPDPSMFSRIDNIIAGAWMAIQNDEELKEAGERLRAIKSVAGEFEAQRKEAVKPLNDAVKQINACFKNPIQECVGAEQSIKQAIATYQRDQEAIRQQKEAELRKQQMIEQERLRREAAKIEAAAAEAERKKQARLDEQLRKMQEKGQADLAAARLKQAEIDRAAREAHAAEEAEALRMMADAAPNAVVLPDAPKIDGVSTRRVWKFTISDVKLLPAMYLLADEKKIGKVVRALGGETNIPGVEVYEDDVVSARS